MAESTASITRAHIKTALRRYLNYALTGTLETDQDTHIDDMIRFGENMFYKGTRLPGESTVHRWSFVEPLATFTITADDFTVDCPDDFGGFVSSFLSFSTDDNAVNTCQIVDIDWVNEQRSLNTALTIEFPTHAAIRLKARSQTTGQRFELVLWPTPSVSCTLYGTYYSNPNLMTDGAPYPLGGQPHGLTLLEACLAAAERHMMDEANGPHFQEFMRMMIDSVAFDRALTTPKYFGQNLDRSGGRRSFRRHLAQGVEYIGPG